MISKLEKRFFKSFEIEPRWKDIRSNKTKIYTEEEAKKIRKTNRNIQLCYPIIDDTKLLKLLSIISSLYDFNGYTVNFKTIEYLKEELLSDLILTLKNKKIIKKRRDDLKNKVTNVFL